MSMKRGGSGIYSRKSTRASMLDISRNLATSKRSQVAVFIIIAIVILGSALIYFILTRDKGPGIATAEFRRAFDYFAGCIDSEVSIASELSETQAGYVKLPEFSPGSDYAPFSSQLDFLGSAVPYWYYVSGNGVVKEQFLAKQEIEAQIEESLKENLKCDFSAFRSEGYEIELGKLEPDVKISDYSIKTKMQASMKVSRGNLTQTKKAHEIETDSRLGRLYGIATKIYNKEKEEAFLEEYGIDVLYLYAPVVGVEVSCSPKTWNFINVSGELRSAIEANTQSIKIGKAKQAKQDEADRYFAINVSGVALRETESVNFIYMDEFPSRIEVWPAKNNLMIAEPVGLQEGLGILGFCYVPYSFVYDMAYPVLVQVYDREEVFQFPVSVVIQKNVAREALPAAIEPEESEEICAKANTRTDIYTYSNTLAPVEADIDFKCFNDVCDIGRTITNADGEAKLSEALPQCVNAVITAKADGYKEMKKIASTNEESSVDILMDRLYAMQVEIFVDGKPLGENETALIHFDDGTETQSMLYPEQTNISIAENYYNITLYVFKASQITLPASTTRQCAEVLREGLLGFFGVKKEQCYEVTFPEQIASNILYAGGRASYYLLESEMQDLQKIEIYADSIGMPQKAEDLPKIYEEFEIKNIDIALR